MRAPLPLPLGQIGYRLSRYYKDTHDSVTVLYGAPRGLYYDSYYIFHDEESSPFVTIYELSDGQVEIQTDRHTYVGGDWGFLIEYLFRLDYDGEFRKHG